MLRLIHNQNVSGPIVINDIDDGLPNKTARRGVAREKVSGSPVLVSGGVLASANSRLDGSSLGGRDKSTLPGVNYSKQKCYIPFYKTLTPTTHDVLIPGYIDLVESDRVLISQAQGVIYGLSQAGNFSGIGTSLTASGSTTTLLDSGGSFLSTDVGKKIEITGATNPSNNGTFVILTVPGPTQVTYTNALGITETSAFNFIVVRTSAVIKVVSIASGALTPPKLTSAVIGSPTAGALRITGTGLTSVEPEITRVVVSGATTVTLTQSQILAAGGSISATQIDIPASLLPVITVGTSVVSLIADSQSSSENLLALANWTSTGWVGTFNSFKHTTGNTTALTNTLAAVVGVIYNVTLTITGRTAGTVAVTFGGVTLPARSTTGTVALAATSTGGLSIAPSTDFDGTLAISINTVASQVTSLVANPAITTAVLKAGVGDSLTFATPTITLVDSAGTFAAGDVGKSIIISGATDPNNNGTFTIATRVSATEITYANAAGSTETSSFVYRVDLTITGTGMASSSPDVTSVYITGTGAVTLTETAITAGGGSVGATSIVIPAALIPSVVPTTSSAQVRAHNQLSTVVAIT